MTYIKTEPGAFRRGFPKWTLSGLYASQGRGGAILTDRTDLCEKLVWHTQHPYRHRRDLRLGLDNKFSLNMRIHPLAAVWANAAWDKALERLQVRQSRCFELVGVLSGTVLVEDVAFEERGIQPAFFRVLVAWKEKAREEEAREEELPAVLRSRGIEAGIEAAPLEPIYRKPAYRAQYGETPKAMCPVAERQADRRFSLTF